MQCRYHSVASTYYLRNFKLPYVFYFRHLWAMRVIFQNQRDFESIFDLLINICAYCITLDFLFKFLLLANARYCDSVFNKYFILRYPLKRRY